MKWLQRWLRKRRIRALIPHAPVTLEHAAQLSGYRQMSLQDNSERWTVLVMWAFLAEEWAKRVVETQDEVKLP